MMELTQNCSEEKEEVKAYWERKPCGTED